MQENYNTLTVPVVRVGNEYLVLRISNGYLVIPVYCVRVSKKEYPNTRAMCKGIDVRRKKNKHSLWLFFRIIYLELHIFIFERTAMFIFFQSQHQNNK